jgi:hypothetical protein
MTDKPSDQTTYPQGVPNPRKLGFIPCWTMTCRLVDQSARIEAVSRALGRPAKLVDPEGYEQEIVAGAIDPVDGRRLAWVECRCKDLGRYVDIGFRLRASVDGRVVIDREVETYNPYFGCHVNFMEWFPEHVVLIYREKHLTLLCAVSLQNQQALVPLDDVWTVAGGVALHRSRQPDLLELVSVPGLDPLTPLPPALVFPGPDQGDPPTLPAPRQLAFPSDPAGFQAALRQRLFGPNPPQPAADLLVGALAFPFWLAPRPKQATYPGKSLRWNSPRFLPFYWHQTLAEPERQAFRALLDQVARTPAEAIRPEWDALGCGSEAAATYLAGQAAALAAICRAGALPPDESCYFWVDWSRQAFRADLHLFPPGFQAVYELLARSSPARHS